MPPRPNYGKRTKGRDLEEIRVALNAGPVAPVGAVDHGALAGLADDDHSQYVHLSSARTITGQHSFSPTSAQAPFALGANAQEQLVTGLNADLLDGLHASEVGVTDAQYLVVATNATLTNERAFSAGAGLTATDGGAGASYTVDIGTPTTLTVATTNATTASSHSHAVTGSADVGTTPAAALLKSTPAGGLILATLETKGALTVTGGDLTADAAGATFIVDESQHNVGIGTLAPDPQFALDVAGPMRAQYYIGPHALQIADAMMICHFDGPEPYTTNYYGEPTGHRGQVPTVSGGVIYRPGKFGKGVQIAEATTNLVTNPSAETNTTGWSGVGLATFERVTTDAYIGASCFHMAEASAAGSGEYASGGFYTVSASTVYTAQARIKKSVPASRTGSLRIWWYTAASGFISADIVTFDAGDLDEWTFYSISATSPATAAKAVVVVVLTLGAGEAGDLWFDAVQLEAKAYPTPYCDGSLGTGHAWTGTAHASTSTRAGAYVTYTNMPMPDEWTVNVWLKPFTLPSEATANIRVWDWYIADNYVILRYDASNNRLDCYCVGDGDLTQIAYTDLTRGADYMLTVTYDGTTLALYANGAVVGTATPTAMTATPTTFYLGSTNDAVQINGTLDDLLIASRALPADEVLSIYESDAPVFAETSTWSWRTISTEGAQVFVNEEGLWMYDSDGGAVVGFSGVNSKSWGGATLNQGDILFGAYGASDGGWLLFNRDGVNSDGLLSLGYGTAEVIRFDDGGASLYGVMDIDTSGGIYQGNGTFASPTTGLKMWNDGGIGRIASYAGGVVQAGFASDGYFVAGAGNVYMSANGLQMIASDDEKAKIKFNNASVSGTNTMNIYSDIGGTDYCYGYISMPDVGSLGNSSTSFTITILDQSGGAGGSYDGGFFQILAMPSYSAVLTDLDFRTAGGVALGSLALNPEPGVLDISEILSTPADTNALGTDCKIYMKANKLIIAFNDSGTMRYKYLDLTGTGYAWAHTTTAP